MYQLNFKLKQHTPIIHFQHDQVGATLRATEVKPKLDRFIINKLGNGNYEAGLAIAKQNRWLIDKEGKKGALDYKLIINSNGENSFENLIDMELEFNKEKGIEVFKRNKDGSFPSFFGNMMKIKEFKDGKEFKKFSYYSEINLIILTNSHTLNNEIDILINDFYENSNFGTRQTKGFGSFTIAGSDINLTKPYLEIDKKEHDIESVFKIINYYHLRLKSGVNFSYYDRRKNEQKCHYKEAFLKKFLREEKLNYEWDKRWMKEEYFPISKNTSDKRFVRALLGLSYDFKFTNRTNPCNKTKNRPANDSFNLSLDKENEIQRIMSPIMYKPIFVNNKWRIYILINQNHISDTLNKVFKFNSDRRSHTPKKLKTPNTILDIPKLISEYHKELGSTFIAYEFNMKSTNVEIKQN